MTCWNASVTLVRLAGIVKSSLWVQFEVEAETVTEASDDAREWASKQHLGWVVDTVVLSDPRRVA